MPQPSERDWDLLLVAAAYAISNDIDLVASSEKINRGLCNADVAFDANDDSGDGALCTERIEGFLDVWRAARSQRRLGRDERKSS